MVTIALNNSAADIRQKFYNSTCHARDTLWSHKSFFFNYGGMEN